jgi:hypothetical protein
MAYLKAWCRSWTVWTGQWRWDKVDNPMDDPEPELYEDSDSDEDEDDIGDNYEVIWEPPPPQVTGSDVEFLDEPEEDLGLSQEARLAAEDAFRNIEKYTVMQVHL